TKSGITGSNGPSLTGFTVSENELLALAMPSLTTMVIVQNPLAFVAGTSVTVAFVPLPPKMIPLTGTRFVLELLPVSTSEFGGVSASSMLNEIGPMGVSSSVIWLEIPEIVGGEFTEIEPSTVLLPGIGSSVVDVTTAMFVQLP